MYSTRLESLAKKCATICDFVNKSLALLSYYQPNRTIMFEDEKLTDADPDVELLREQLRAQRDQIERLTGAIETMRAHSDFKQMSFDDFSRGTRKVQSFAVASMTAKDAIATSNAIRNHAAAQLEARPPSKNINHDWYMSQYARHTYEAINAAARLEKLTDKGQRAVAENQLQRSLRESAAHAKLVGIVPFLKEATI
jgi:hypothetical protein